MEASQVLENELHLEVDGFVFKFYPRVWPRNYIGIVSEKQIAEMRKYLVYRSSHVVTQGTKLWWQLYFYREPRKNSTPLYDIEKRPIHSCGEVGYVHKRPVPEAFEKYFSSEPELRQVAPIQSQQSDQGQSDIVSQEQQQSTPSSVTHVSGNRQSLTIACDRAAAQREETWILDSLGGNFLRNWLETGHPDAWAPSARLGPYVREKGPCDNSLKKHQQSATWADVIRGVDLKSHGIYTFKDFPKYNRITCNLIGQDLEGNEPPTLTPSPGAPSRATAAHDRFGRRGSRRPGPSLSITSKGVTILLGDGAICASGRLRSCLSSMRNLNTCRCMRVVGSQRRQLRVWACRACLPPRALLRMLMRACVCARARVRVWRVRACMLACIRARARVPGRSCLCIPQLLDGLVAWCPTNPEPPCGWR